ncbi:hypothetical protein V6N13_042108 [Hibiscus sabdariffa]
MVARPLLAKVKETTGIVGLDVVPNAREVLIGLYSKTLKEIQAVPEDEGYRKAVESFTRHRLKVCQEEEDWEVIEKRLGCGQVEELIEEARDELTLIGKMIEWDPWGVPDDYECEVIENDAPVPKHVPLHRPGPLPEEFYKTLEAISKKDEPKISSGEPQIKDCLVDQSICSMGHCLPPLGGCLVTSELLMASALETKAKEAFIDDHFELALHFYSQAIEQNPNQAELYAGRAQANIKLNNLPEAVADANKAIELDPSMSKAYLRKATACMKLEEYQTAKAALEAGAALAPGESRFSKLIKECEERIAAEAGELPMQTPEERKPNLRIGMNFSRSQKKWLSQFLPREYRVNMLKLIMLSVAINAPGKAAYHFQPRLFGKITPDKCKYDVFATKIEIRLAKAEPIHWTSLEYSREAVVPQRINVSSVAANQRSAYPSSKPKRVDWDKIEAQVKKEEKDEQLDGDAALNKFFRNIYQDADEDARRAMQKSFVESNGTVLSTNWKEVGVKKVEGSPPDGMELKKWEY